MGFENTLTFVEVNDRNRFYIKNHILNSLDIKDGDKLKVFADPETGEILLKPKNDNTIQNKQSKKERRI